MEPAHHRAQTIASISRKQRHVNTQHQYERTARKEEMRRVRNESGKARQKGRGRREMSDEKVPFIRVIKIYNTWV